MLNFPATLIHELLLPPCETVQQARDWLDIRRQSLIPCHYSGLDFAALYVSCTDDTFRFFGHVPAEWLPTDGELKAEFQRHWDQHPQYRSPERLQHWLILFDQWEERGLPVAHYRRQFQRFYMDFWWQLPRDIRRITSGQPVGSVAVDFTLKPGDLVFHPEHGPIILDGEGYAKIRGKTYWQVGHSTVLPMFLAHNWNWPQRAAELWERTVRPMPDNDLPRRLQLRNLLRQSGYVPD